MISLYSSSLESIEKFPPIFWHVRVSFFRLLILDFPSLRGFSNDNPIVTDKQLTQHRRKQKMEDAQNLIINLKTKCPDVRIRLPKHKWSKSWDHIEHLVVPLERILYGHPLARLLWERQFEKTLMELSWEKVQTGNAFSFTENKSKSFRSKWIPSKWPERSRIWL